MTSSTANTVWKGYVLDPRNGAFHPALLALDAFRRLILRGYVFVPLFGRSTVWTTYTGPYFAQLANFRGKPNRKPGKQPLFEKSGAKTFVAHVPGASPPQTQINTGPN